MYITFNTLVSDQNFKKKKKKKLMMTMKILAAEPTLFIKRVNSPLEAAGRRRFRHTPGTTSSGNNNNYNNNNKNNTNINTNNNINTNTNKDKNRTAQIRGLRK